jgi:hypothetical protein
MIKLDAIACCTVNGSLQTAGTMTQVSGVFFVTVGHDHPSRKYPARLCSVSDARKRRVNPLSQPMGALSRAWTRPKVSALKVGSSSQHCQRRARPTCSQAFDAAHPGPKQHQRRFHHRCGGNARLLSAVGNQCDNAFGELKNLFRIGDQATKNDYRFFS